MGLLDELIESDEQSAHQPRALTPRDVEPTGTTSHSPQHAPELSTWTKPELAGRDDYVARKPEAGWLFNIVDAVRIDTKETFAAFQPLISETDSMEQRCTTFGGRDRNAASGSATWYNGHTLSLKASGGYCDLGKLTFANQCDG